MKTVQSPNSCTQGSIFPQRMRSKYGSNPTRSTAPPPDPDKFTPILTRNVLESELLMIRQ
jgi:hypothetical protein